MAEVDDVLMATVATFERRGSPLRLNPLVDLVSLATDTSRRDVKAAALRLIDTGSLTVGGDDYKIRTAR